MSLEMRAAIVWTGSALVGVLLLGGMVFVAARTPATSPSATAAASGGAGPAMRRCAKTLRERHLRPSPANDAERAHNEAVEGYCTLIENEEPFVAGWPYSALSVEVVSMLGEGLSEAWLRRCLENARVNSGSTEWFYQAWKRYPETTLNRLNYQWPLPTIEAVFNLSKSEPTRMDAKVLYDQIAGAKYDSSVAHWESLRGQPGMQMGPRPRLRGLEIWGKEGPSRFGLPPLQPFDAKP